MPFEQLIEAVGAASLLGIHPKTLIRLARQGKVPAVRLGRLWRFRTSALDAWVTSQGQSAGQSVLSAQERI